MDWHVSGDYSDIRYETAEGIAKITIERPEIRNAFRPLTTRELISAFDVARDDAGIGVIILTGQGSAAFSCGGGQSRPGGARRSAAARGRRLQSPPSPAAISRRPPPALRRL